MELQHFQSQNRRNTSSQPYYQKIYQYIINQQPQFATNNAKKIKSKIKLTKMQHRNEELQKLWSTLTDKQYRLNELNREQGASS